MFFRNKKRNEIDGLDRISRMIESRQAGDDDDDAVMDDLFGEETVLLGRGATGRDESSARPAQREREIEPPTESLDLDDEPEESVTVFRRAPERTPEPERAAPPMYQPEPAPPAPAPVAAPRMSLPDLSLGTTQSGASLIAKDAQWEGKLVCSGNVRVEGRLRGEIETDGNVVVAPEAMVEGSIKAKTVTLGGEIQGDIYCSERLEVLPGGLARGDVHTGTLVVHEGATIESRFQMSRDAVTA